MAFQSDQRIKVQIITTLGADQIFRLLSDSDINIVMKTLGLLRNVVAHKSQIGNFQLFILTRKSATIEFPIFVFFSILCNFSNLSNFPNFSNFQFFNFHQFSIFLLDHVMSLFGKHIMQAVVLILESDNNADVKEQALCILANIADGDNAKSFIMANEDVLKKITSYLMHNNTKLQMAAVVCIYNLAYIEESGAGERQARLREVGVHKILGQLLAASDQSLSEKWVF